MGARPKIKRVQLKLSQNHESALFGIVSTEPDYKLSLALNRKLKISLKNSTPVMIPDKTSEMTFSRFSDTSASHNRVLELTSNRSGKDFLLGKLRNIDFILQITDSDVEINADEIIAHMRNIESVTAVFNLDPLSIKDKNMKYIIH